MKIVLKYISYILISLLLFISIYTTLALILSKCRIKKEVITEATPIELYIKTNGVHTDLIVPIKTSNIDWSKTILFKNTIANDSSNKYIAFGWGNKGFYLETPTWADLKFSTAFNATFGLSGSAIHTTFYHKLQEDKTCKKMYLSEEQYDRFIKYIENTLQKDVNGKYILIKTTANYDNHDAFYEANGRYNLFKTCNTWANNGLKACGQKAAVWTPFDYGIFDLY